MKKTVSFYTLGCKVNQYETNAMEQQYIKCLPFYYVRRYVMTKKNMLLTMLMVVINNWLLNMVLTMGLMITVKNKNDKVSKGGC